MDFPVNDATATDDERAAIEVFLGTPASRWEGGARDASDDTQHALGGHAARAQRHLLLPALHALQARIGWISPGAVNHLALRLSVPPAEIHGVASFYAMFELEATPPTVVHVCDDIACHTAGAESLIDSLQRAHGPAGKPCAGGRAAWKRSPCLGLCEQAPAALFQRAGEGRANAALGGVNLADLEAELAGGGARVREDVPLVQQGEAGLRLLRRVGVVAPDDLAGYRRAGGYEVLQRAFELGPQGVLAELTESKLLGRGGAAFPTGVKWSAVARAPALPHHVVCNADESEPGTFKDRVLMEQDPFAVIESMTIAAWATGATKGWIYLRGEYPEAQARLSRAITLAREAGWLGAAVAGRADFAFDIEVRLGAGAYICGEETALLNSIEGYRGEPRNKPPFPVTEGLFNQPTAVNNVETLVAVLEVLRQAEVHYNTFGTEQSRGTKLLCVSGCVERPGLYELPFGVTLRQLLERAGGVRDGRPLRAILLGGAAGSFMTPDQIDVSLSFEHTRAIGASLGSGVIMVFDDTIDMERIVLR
ncbi:MAG: NAD(P)H-dependent oxidoreductase subunit E, partial [Candidatus Eisenbacteria bacterium]